MTSKIRQTTRFTIGLLSIILTLLFISSTVKAADREPENSDKTLSPFFFVKTDDPAVDALPLKSTRADVRIAGVIAHVTVTQVYKNEGKNPLEAIYVFPGSTRAAVHAMRMTVGERVIDAEIMERKAARETYEQAKKEGKTASLLEQQRPNVFQMNVANILPGDVIKVEMQYTELIEPEEQVYEFVYPAVVGPRYSETTSQGAADNDKWVENPYLHSGEKAPYDFDLNLQINTAIPLSQAASPSHDVEITYDGKQKASIALKNPQNAGTKDFVLRYKLSGGKIETGLMLYPGEKENFFLMMMEPPDRVVPDAVVPREYIFIVDVSGSMNGFPLNDVAKPLMKDLITNLRPEDYMNVMLFAGGSAVLSEQESLPATKANKQHAVNWIYSAQGGGGTRILPAIEKALALPATEGVSRIIVVVTDGYVDVEPQVFELINKNLGKANLFAFGIGSSVNRYLIEGMARSGMGSPFIVLNSQEGIRAASKFKKYIESPVLTDIKVDFNGFKAYDVEPTAVPDLFSQRPIILFGKYKGDASGQITVTGKSAQGAFKETMTVSQDQASDSNKALPLLWARHRILRIDDMNALGRDERRVKEVTELGLEYSLMTQYTSFVAVDKVKRADGKLVTVKQPLPLPEGVSDLAVGDRAMASAPRGRLYKAGGVMTETARPAEPTAPVPANGNGKKDMDSGEKEEGVEMISFSIESIKGPLSKSQAEQLLKTNMKLLRACYLKAMRLRNVKPEGDITFKLSIGTDGVVKSAEKAVTTMNDAPMEMCLKTALESIRFPASKSANEVTIKLSCSIVK